MSLIIKREQLFYIGLFAFIIRNFVIFTSIYLPDKILLFLIMIAIGCWCVAIFMEYDTAYHTMLKCLLIAVGFANAIIADSWNILALFTMVLASKKISMQKIVKFVFIISSFLLISDVLIYFLNLLLGNVQITQTRDVGGEFVKRHQFYFSNANGFSMYFIFTIFMYIYLKYEKISKWKIYTLLLGAAIFIYIFPNTRTVSIMSLIFILLDIVSYKKGEKIVLFLCKNMFVIGFILTAVLLTIFIINPHSQISTVANYIMNGRLTMVAGALEQYDLKLLGQPIVNSEIYSAKYGYYTLYIDNFYGRLFIQYGILPAIIVSFLAIRTSNILYKKGKKLELFLFAMVFIFGLSESTAIEIYPVFPLLFMRENFSIKQNNKK